MRQAVALSAYPLSPAFTDWDPKVEEEVLGGLAQLDGVSALEVPWVGKVHPHDNDWFLDHVPAVDLVVTPLPYVMKQLATPGYGIASPDEAGRTAAVNDLVRAAADVATITERSVARVAAVELHTAPRAVADATALARSLEEVSALDWAGARLVIEHCDAQLRGQKAEKGFLSLEDEIAAIRSSSADVGLWMNWGRSAIELRDPDAVTSQIAVAAESGLLDGLVLSGASDATGPYGEAWADSHHPFASIDPESQSLLTDVRVYEALRAAGSVPWLGVKVSRRPAERNVEQVIALAERHLSALSQACGR